MLKKAAIQMNHGLLSVSIFAYFYAVFLELPGISGLFNRHCHTDGHSDHGIISRTDETHHLYVSRNGRRTCKLCIRVHTS